MNINFQTLKLKNFMSYGAKTTEFNFEHGIDLVLGENGKGKSVLSDALCYSLYGKAFRKVKTASLINNINKKNTLVELEFNVDNKDSYVIKRGMKPPVFEIYKNGEIIDEEANKKDYQKILEENIIKTTELIYRQLVSLGANNSQSKNFMDLSTKEKEDVFQILTDTKFFKEMSQLIKKKSQTIKTSKSELSYKTGVLNNSIMTQEQSIAELEKKNQEFSTRNEDVIVQLQNEITAERTNIEKFQKGIDFLGELKKEYDVIKSENNDLLTEKAALLKDQRTYELRAHTKQAAEDSSITCENCDHVNYTVEFDNNDYSTILQNIATSLSEKDQIITAKTASLDEMKSKLLDANRLVSMIQDSKNRIAVDEQKIKTIKETNHIEIDYSVLENLTVERDNIKKDLDTINNELLNYEFIDGIISSDNLKGFMISQQIPVLNKYINMYLEKFSLTGFNFIIDKDFKEQIINRSSDREFNSMSNGQKFRINFSIMFSFLKLVEERNGTKLNLLILDESLDSSLDFNGRNELLEILQTDFSKAKNIQIISHNSDIKEKSEIFNRIIEVTSEKNMSLINVSNVKESV